MEQVKLYVATMSYKDKVTVEGGMLAKSEDEVRETLNKNFGDLEEFSIDKIEEMTDEPVLQGLFGEEDKSKLN